MLGLDVVAVLRELGLFSVINEYFAFFHLADGLGVCALKDQELFFYMVGYILNVMSDSKLNGGKGQSGIEVFTTYGWVVLVAVGGILILSQVGVFRPSHCDKSRIGFSQVVPVDWAAYMSPDSFALKLENWAGDAVSVTGVTVSLQQVDCGGAASIGIGAGDSTVVALSCVGSMSEKYAVGDCYSADVDITYVNQRSGNIEKSKGKVRGSIEVGAVATSTTTTSTSTTTTTTTTSTSTTTTIPPELELLSPAGVIPL